ncbi:ABC transporter permease [Paenibacillus sp. 481]|uniref:ABC transporter permease n=1 Tax=Paenibacillus sp. 481 TaxID=2835869 RepID=UPI001E63A2BD|nr:ABC transporter permease [Paenibacillus sp. 481]UHA74542.1 ABC transporter permease [Paenibacillus sp. 481]
MGELKKESVKRFERDELNEPEAGQHPEAVARSAVGQASAAWSAFDADQLWKQRVRQFWGRILPYLRYVMQSGVAVLFAFVFITGTAYYANFLERIPVDFPVRELSLLLLAPTVAYMAYRTFFQPADIVFLLRSEQQLGAYLKRSIKYSLRTRLLLLLVVWSVLWPLYNRGDIEPKGYAVMLAGLILIKLVAAYGAWKERHMEDPANSKVSRVLRYGWAWGATACWLWLSVPLAIVCTVAAGAAYVGWLLTRRTLRFPWEAHIQAEEMHTSRIYLLLSGFVDLPTMTERRYSRPWLNQVGDRYAFQRETAYHYLLAKTFARSELVSILLRLNVLGLILMLWLQHSTWSVVIYGLFMLIIGIQIKALATYHRYDVWQTIYPLSLQMRQRAVLHLSTWLHLLSGLVLAVPIWIGTITWQYKGVVLVVGLAFVIVMRLRLRRTHQRDDGED